MRVILAGLAVQESKGGLEEEPTDRGLGKTSPFFPSNLSSLETRRQRPFQSATMTQQSSSIAFQDDFTHSHGGGCFFIAVDPNFPSDVNLPLYPLPGPNATSYSQLTRVP